MFSLNKLLVLFYYSNTYLITIKKSIKPNCEKKKKKVKHKTNNYMIIK